MSPFAFLQRYRDGISGLAFRPILDAIDRTAAAPSADELRALLRRVDARARATYWISGHPAASAIPDLFRRTAPRDARRIARDLHAASRRHAVLRAVAERHGIETLSPLVEFHGTRHLAQQISGQRGAILVFGHMGPFGTTTAGLLRLRVPVLLVTATGQRLKYPSGIEAWNAKQAADDAMLFLKRGLEFLAQGRCVLVAIDGDKGAASVDHVFLGRRVGFRRGLGTLHALSRAPVIPLHTSWSGVDGLRFEAHASLEPASAAAPREERESVITEQAVRWLERQLSAEPANLQLARVPYYARQPRAT